MLRSWLECSAVGSMGILLGWGGFSIERESVVAGRRFSSSLEKNLGRKLSKRGTRDQEENREKKEGNWQGHSDFLMGFWGSHRVGSLRQVLERKEARKRKEELVGLAWAGGREGLLTAEPTLLVRSVLRYDCHGSSALFHCHVISFFFLAIFRDCLFDWAWILGYLFEFIGFLSCSWECCCFTFITLVVGLEIIWFHFNYIILRRSYFCLYA